VSSLTCTFSVRFVPLCGRTYGDRVRTDPSVTSRRRPSGRRRTARRAPHAGRTGDPPQSWGEAPERLDEPSGAGRPSRPNPSA